MLARLAKWPRVQQQGEKMREKEYHKKYKMKQKVKQNLLFSICI